LAAFNQGARFDAWGNLFNFNIWQQAFSGCALDPHSYLIEKPKDSMLAWDFIDVGVSKDNLLAEYDKTIAIQ